MVMAEPIPEDQHGGQTGRARKRAIVPFIALLSALSPCCLSFLILIVALVFSSAFEPPPRHSSALYSPNIVYLYALALPMFILVPFGFVLGVITVVKDRHRGSGPGHPLSWAAIALSGLCLVSACMMTFQPMLLQ
jgi:hypothetical protein